MKVVISQQYASQPIITALVQDILTTLLQAILTGGTILSLTIDPVLGGCTRVEGGHPPTILSAGYIGSALLGGVFILGGFDTLVAKIESFILGIGLLIPLVLVRDKTLVHHSSFLCCFVLNV